MFYLIETFKVFKSYPFRVSAFFIATLMFYLSAGQGEFLAKKAMTNVTKVQSAPYMNALISGRENYSRISRKVEGLPGVERVKILDQSFVIKKMKAILNQVDDNLKEDISKVNYAGLKIIFKEGLKVNTQNLIKDYINRLAGKENVTLSQVKANKSQGKKVSAKKWGRYAFFALSGLFWMFSFFWLRGALSKTAFCIEQFQRRNKVSLKLYACLFLFCSIVAIPLTLSWGLPTISGILLSSFIMCTFLGLFSRKNTWAN